MDISSMDKEMDSSNENVSNDSNHEGDIYKFNSSDSQHPKLHILTHNRLS